MKTSLLAAAFTMTATVALAHAKPATTTPQEGSTVAAADTIAIHFDDPMRVTAITMTGQAGAVDVTRITGMEPVNDFNAAAPADLPQGAYTVEWRGLSADGHPMQGSFAFTVGN